MGGAGPPGRVRLTQLLRATNVKIADVFRLDTPSYENEELLAKIRELKAEWDPKLREAMDEIAARGR